MFQLKSNASVESIPQLSTSVVSSNYFDLKIQAWKSELKNMELEISAIEDITWTNLLSKFFQNQNLDDLYKQLNQISIEVNNLLDHEISVIFIKSSENYTFYFAKMQEILSAVKMSMEQLYKKDLKVFIFNWKLDSMLL
ncbi:MAG: hypothetical protein EAZ76_07540 [Nostocales cyanobacterium]|nr:MAG: hypothetical protein EAZ87_21825 [Nostocales cyanobacterium]TAF16363.1 MAG: hypothetical protein EAZ76_07540 [Nostocales cyanobacterium]